MANRPKQTWVVINRNLTNEPNFACFWNEDAVDPTKMFVPLADASVYTRNTTDLAKGCEWIRTEDAIYLAIYRAIRANRQMIRASRQMPDGMPEFVEDYMATNMALGLANTAYIQSDLASVDHIDGLPRFYQVGSKNFVKFADATPFKNTEWPASLEVVQARKIWPDAKWVSSREAFNSTLNADEEELRIELPQPNALADREALANAPDNQGPDEPNDIWDNRPPNSAMLWVLADIKSLESPGETLFKDRDAYASQLPFAEIFTEKQRDEFTHRYPTRSYAWITLKEAIGHMATYERTLVESPVTKQGYVTAKQVGHYYDMLNLLQELSAQLTKGYTERKTNFLYNEDARLIGAVFDSIGFAIARMQLRLGGNFEEIEK